MKTPLRHPTGDGEYRNEGPLLPRLPPPTEDVRTPTPSPPLPSFTGPEGHPHPHRVPSRQCFPVPSLGTPTGLVGVRSQSRYDLSSQSREGLQVPEEDLQDPSSILSLGERDDPEGQAGQCREVAAVGPATSAPTGGRHPRTHPSSPASAPGRSPSPTPDPRVVPDPIDHPDPGPLLPGVRGAFRRVSRPGSRSGRLPGSPAPPRPGPGGPGEERPPSPPVSEG